MSVEPPSRSLSLLAAVLCAAVGCGGVRLKPDGTPEREFCPDGALEAMGDLGIIQGDSSSVLVEERWERKRPVLLVDGPVVGVIEERLGNLPEGTRVFGHVWTGGRRVVIRYYAAQVPGNTAIPFCAVAEDGEGLDKLPGSKPGTAMLPDGYTGLRVVGAYY